MSSTKLTPTSTFSTGWSFSAIWKGKSSAINSDEGSSSTESSGIVEKNSLKAEPSTATTTTSKFFDSITSAAKRKESAPPLPLSGVMDEKRGENGQLQEVSFTGEIANRFQEIKNKIAVKISFNKGKPTKLACSDSDGAAMVEMPEAELVQASTEAKEETQESKGAFDPLTSLKRLSDAIAAREKVLAGKFFRTPAEKIVQKKLADIGKLLALAHTIVQKNQAGEQDWVKELELELKNFLLEALEENEVKDELTVDKAQILLNRKLNELATIEEQEKGKGFVYKNWGKFISILATAISVACSIKSCGVGGILGSAFTREAGGAAREKIWADTASQEAFVYGCAECLIYLLNQNLSENKEVIVQIANPNPEISKEVSRFTAQILVGIKDGLEAVKGDLAGVRSNLEGVSDDLVEIRDDVGDMKRVQQAHTKSLDGLDARLDTIEALLRERAQEPTEGSSSQSMPIPRARKPSASSDLSATLDISAPSSADSSRASSPIPTLSSSELEDLYKPWRDAFNAQTDYIRLLLEQAENIASSLKEEKANEILSGLIMKGLENQDDMEKFADSLVDEVKLPRQAEKKFLLKVQSYNQSLQRLKNFYLSLEKDISEAKIKEEFFQIAGIKVAEASNT